MSEHNCEAEELYNDKSGDCPSQAVCSCGWEGAVYEWWHDADNEAIEHCLKEATAAAMAISWKEVVRTMDPIHYTEKDHLSPRAHICCIFCTTHSNGEETFQTRETFVHKTWCPWLLAQQQGDAA